MMIRRIALCLAWMAFPAIFFVLGLFFLEANALTVDESNHLGAGYSHLATGDFRLNAEHPPFLKLLSALPVYLWYRLPFEPDPELWMTRQQKPIGLNFLYRSGVPADDLLWLARLPTLLLGAVLVVLAGWWAYRLWGTPAAFLTLALTAFDPNLLAHACLVNTDLGVTFFVFLTAYLLWENAAAPSLGLVLAIGAAAGLALASKYSAVFLVGLLGMVAVLHAGFGGLLPCPAAPLPRIPFLARLIEAGFTSWIILTVAAVAVLGSYFFVDTETWWIGLHMVLTHQKVGHPSFFLGEYSHEGWWHYFPVAFLLKTPLGSLALSVASLVFFAAGQRLGRRELVFLLLPVVLYFAIASRARINIGLRHLLPVYPFLYVLAGRVLTIRLRPAWLAPALAGLAAVLSAVSVLRVAPHQLAYFNELIGGPDNGHHYLSDSNLDWGQGLKGLQAYLEREGMPVIYLSYFGNASPAYYGIRYQPLPAPEMGQLDPPSKDCVPVGAARSLVVLSVKNVQGVLFADKQLYGWFRRRTPTARIGYALWVYDISGDVEGHLALAEIYRKSGERPLVVHELHKVLALDAEHAEARQLLRTLGDQ